ncbi:MAG: hypothetical protein HZC47_05150 [Methanobacterium sp.]|uniref:hypothetical protein n=1 Tax=Methanobacterium sp. TaxID=2164 RepID=UPI003D6577EE|nr:hypothetical protein [Methanobacterium sp.]
MSFNPLYSFLNTIKNIIFRKIHFPKNKIGKILITEDGQEFSIFREVKIDHTDDPNDSAVFKVKFLLENMKVQDNIRFSWIPVPFFVGLPGFQAKVWTINYKNGFFQGIYQWKNSDYAKKYSKSFAYNFMTRRSTPGSVSFEIITHTNLEDYLKTL